MSEGPAFDPFAPGSNNYGGDPRVHWSERIEWRPGRWDPMSNAPMTGPIVHVRGRDKNGVLLEPMHYAYGGGEEQPPFRGWFIPYSNPKLGFHQVNPVEWQPLKASPDEL